MTENPFSPPTSSADDITQPVSKRTKRITLVELLVIVAIVLIVIGLFTPASRGVRPAARRMACSQNLKQIGVALRNYESRYNCFPPAYTMDSDGQPLHSWRSLILPFLEQTELYQKIDFSKAWDAPENEAARVTAAGLPVFSCPSSTGNYLDGMTSYLALVDDVHGLHPTQGRVSQDLKGESNKVLIVLDAPTRMETHWMSPKDMTLAEFQQIDVKKDKPHHNAYLGLFADGSVQTSDTLSQGKWE